MKGANEKGGLQDAIKHPDFLLFRIYDEETLLFFFFLFLKRMTNR